MDTIKSIASNLPESVGDVGINLLIALYSVACSFVSDWLSQVLANLLNIEKSSSWTFALLLTIALISTQLLKLWADKQQRTGKKATDKILLLGNSFSMVLLVRIFSPCWADCLTCEVQGPTAPLIKSGMALMPFLLSAGVSYQARNAENEASNRWLTFSHRFDHTRIITRAIFEKIQKGIDSRITEDEIIRFYRKNRIPFDNVNQIREQMSRFVIDTQAKGGLPYGSHHFKFEFYQSKHGNWVIEAYKFDGRLK